MNSHNNELMKFLVVDMFVWLALGSSVTLVLVLSLVTRYYRAKFLRMHKTTNGPVKVVFDDEDVAFEDQDDDDNKRISSAADEFDHMFPYKEQIEHFLTATRDLRKSRRATKLLFTHPS